MRQSDDRAFEHIWNEVDLDLDLLRMNVVTARNDHILRAPTFKGSRWRNTRLLSVTASNSSLRKRFMSTPLMDHSVRNCPLELTVSRCDDWTGRSSPSPASMSIKMAGSRCDRSIVSENTSKRL